MSMDILIRGPDGIRRAGALVIGQGVPVGTTAGGLPELLASVPFAEAQLMPSGGDDAPAIRDALTRAPRVRLGPGTFTVTSLIYLGTGQSLVGSGPDQTTVHIPEYNQAYAIALGSGATLEELTVRGIGGAGSYMGIYADGATDIRLRGLRVTDLPNPIQLSRVSRAEISRVTVEGFSTTGISVTESEQVVVAAVTVNGQNQLVGIVLSLIDGLRCEGVTVRRCARAIQATGNGLVFRAIHLLDRCRGGIFISSGRGVELSGVHAADCPTVSPFISLSDTTGALVSGCSVLRGSKTALSISNCTAVTVSGVHSDMTGTSAATVPHVMVGGGSTEVMISGVRVVNPATPPQYEVDVSGAGGRVLFAQHNFDPARINSGGNFAAL